ncbi:MAG: hypothetical protein ACP5P9_02735 [Acidimicrobiales bacterium]
MATTTSDLPALGADDGPDAWFEALADVAQGEAERLAALGMADFRLLIEVTSETDTARYGVVLDGYDITVTHRLGPQEVSSFDAVLRGETASWQELVENILANDGADISHSLNALSIAGWPLQLSSDDPVGRDKFFRYAETLQALFDGIGRVRSSRDATTGQEA